MIQVRRSDERGFADHGWLKTFHTFSFSDYYDPAFLGFRDLRVINEDHVAPGMGFATHGHQDMEIITYIISGALEHKDSMGNTAVIWPGEVQRMSAGTGVRHSEYNHSKAQPVHLLQIWILPNKKSIEPGYEQKSFAQVIERQNFALVASEDGREGSVQLHQDVQVWVGKSKQPGEKTLNIDLGRHIWLQVVSGEINVLDKILRAGDGAAISDLKEVQIKWSSDSEFLLINLK